MKKSTLSLIIITLLLSACLPDEARFNAFRKAEVQRLLSNQESKIWELKERYLSKDEVSLEACDQTRRLIFKYTEAAKEGNPLFYVNPGDTCSNKEDTLKGVWFVPPTVTAETPTDTVVFVWESTDTAYFQISDLSPDHFSISTYFEEDSLRESFSHLPAE